MKENKFIIIIPFYNVEKWIKKNIKSVLLQDYSNFECYLVDDISTDETVSIAKKLIGDDSRFHIIENTTKKFALKNIYEAVATSGEDPEDIIVTLDGDDFFATKRVLSVLNETYNNRRCLMTYGYYMEFPSMKKGKFCKQIPDETVKFSWYRKDLWLSSHLRTFKRSLWDRINPDDLKGQDGEFYKMTWDMAFMFPMLEMAGPLAVHIPEILYLYNRENPNNDDKVNHALQLRTENEIRSKDPYQQYFVSCNVRGPGPANSGLGNQLFCIANALSYAKDSNKVAFFPTLNAEADLKKYKDVFYKKLKIGRNINMHDSTYAESSFGYSEIPDLNGNVFLDGYFQSAKYFEHNRDFILEELNIPELKSIVSEKYGDFSSYTSIHVRRGDYLKLKDYHGLLDVEYYKKATSLIGQDEKFVVFSDDIEWCKNNLTFLNNVIYFSCEEDWEDMVLMATCRNNIIANSTFSWWSAWLSGNEAIAPNEWFANGINTSDLYCEGWEKLSW